MNSKMDPMGRAIADYWKTMVSTNRPMVSTNRPKKADRLRVFSPMFEEDEIPLRTLFRTYETMSKIERKALNIAKGKTLDVGAASGCHSLVLQKKSIDVTAIDMPKFFKQLDKILAPGGQVLCDSSDISYVFEDEDGIIEYPDTDGYYGEQSFQMQYKDTIGEPFPWLYIDADTLKQVAEENGYVAEVITEGEHYDYLARITKRV